MKILVINPPRVKGYPVVREERFEHKETDSVYPPLSHLYVAALLEKEGFDVKVIDANGFNLNLSKIKWIIQKERPDIVFSRIAFDSQSEDMKVLKIAKDFGATTLVRNRIISQVKDLKTKILKLGFADIFINQEPETIVLEICKAFKNGKSIFNVRGVSYLRNNKVIDNKDSNLISFNELPLPAYHLLPTLKPYYSGVLLKKPFISIMTSTGCPYSCTFCAYSNSKYQFRSVENIINELIILKKRFRIKSFFIFDDIFTLDIKRAKTFCRELINKNLNLTWTSCTRIDSVDRELIRLMKRAGCLEIAFGIESGSESVLKNINKRITKEKIIEISNICKEEGMKFYCMIILGLPGETKETFKETLELVKIINPFYTQFCFPVPFPNTAIFKYYKDKNYLYSEEWDKYNPLTKEPLVRTDSLSREDLINLRNEAYNRFSLNFISLIKHVKLKDMGYNIRGLRFVLSKLISRNKLLR